MIYIYDYKTDLSKNPITYRVIRLLKITSIIKIHKQPAKLFFLCYSLSFLLMQIKHIICPMQKNGKIKRSVHDKLQLFLHGCRKH